MALSIYEKREYANNLREQVKVGKCSDPRDRIFAVMSTSSLRERSVNIEADYSMTTEEVYRHFTTKQILHTNRLDLLTACEIKSDNDGWHNSMPSWVPDWRRPLVPDRLLTLFASGRSKAAAQFDYKEKTLALTGVKCATVTKVQPASIRQLGDRYDGFELADSIRRCIRSWALSERYVTGENSHDVHVRTVCGGQFSHSRKPPTPNFLNYEICSSTLNRLLQSCSREEDRTVIFEGCDTRFVGRTAALSQGRSCFTTREGYIGFAPSGVKAGDIICVLLGCDVPMILRPNEEERFSIVGECYCHGIMDGAALLGPLPEGFEFVLNFYQRWGGYFPAYVDRQNGKVQWEDPRLAGHPFPSPWRVYGRNDGTCVYFVEEK
jgi:hypothetical protein